MKINEDQLKLDFYAFAKSIITNEESQEIFDRFWSENSYRYAYSIYREYSDTEKSGLSSINSKLDKDFYWLFVN